MIAIGIDPDLHDTAIGVWDSETDEPIAAHVIHTPRRKGVIRWEAVLEMADALTQLPVICRPFSPEVMVVEAQELKRSGQKKHQRPEDIVILGNVGGLCLAQAKKVCHNTLFAPPSEWKGSAFFHFPNLSCSIPCLFM